MNTANPVDPREILRDPETLAVLERNLRGAGMPRRRFLAMASAAAGTAALAACGGTSSPTATSAPAATATRPAAAPTTAAKRRMAVLRTVASLHSSESRRPFAMSPGASMS